MKRLLLLLALLSALAPGAFAQAVLRKGDIFEMRLSGMPLEFSNEFALQYTVGDEGHVKIPYVGELAAGGVTVTDFARSIERKLVSEEIFTNPTVVINLLPQSRFVTIGGEVRSPQRVAWSPDLTLSSAIFQAGGLTEWGSMKKVKLTRENGSKTFNVTKAEKDPTQNPKLLPGDQVEVL